MDSPDKAQYDPEGVCEFGGADWRDLCATTSDKHLALREMRAFIRENNVVDFYLFWDWCDEHNDEWSRLLDDSCCYAIEHYMRSFRAAQVVTQEDREALRAKRGDDGCHTDCQTGAIRE